MQEKHRYIAFLILLDNHMKSYASKHCKNPGSYGPRIGRKSIDEQKWQVCIKLTLG